MLARCIELTLLLENADMAASGLMLIRLSVVLEKAALTTSGLLSILLSVTG
jgi:hypothetical protein